MNEKSIRLPDQLYEAVRQRAKVEDKTTDTLVIEWVADRIQDLENRGDDLVAFEQEVAAFERLKPELLERYDGQYVAIYEGEVVTSGEDKMALLHEVYERYGQVVCYIDLVGADRLRSAHMPSVRVTRR